MTSPLVIEHAIGMNTSSYHALCFHPHDGGSSILCHGSGKLVVLVDVSDPHGQVMLEGHDAEISCLDISADGSMLASGQRGTVMGSSFVILWDYAARAPRLRSPSHSGGMCDCKFSPDGKFIASTGLNDGSVYMMDTNELKLLGQITDSMCAEGSKGGIHGIVWTSSPTNSNSARESTYTICVAFNTGVRILTWSFDVKQMMYVISSQTCHVPGSGGRMGGFMRSYLCACGSLDRSFVLGGTTTGDLVVYSMPSKTYRTCISVTNNGVTALQCVGPDTYILCGGDGRVCKIVGQDQEWKMIGEIGLGVPIISLTVSRDNVECAVLTSTGQLYRVLTKDLTYTLVSEFHSGCIYDVSPCTSSPSYMATVSVDGYVRVWDLNTYSVTAKSPTLTTGVYPSCVAYRPGDQEIVVGFSDGHVSAYAASLKSTLWTLTQVHKDAVVQVECCDLYFVTIGKNDSAVRVWSLKTKELVCQLQDSSNVVCRVLIDNSTTNILHTLSTDGTLFSFDFSQVDRRAEANLSKPRKIASHTMKATLATCMAQRLDHEHELIVGTSDGRILFFDIDYVEPVFTIVDRSKVSVMCLAVCPSTTRHFVSGGKDGTLTLYEFEDSSGPLGGVGCAAIAQVVAHSEPVLKVTWSADGKQVFSVDGAGQLNVSDFFL